jgi:simple sugar transport system ATP-binding protein
VRAGEIVGIAGVDGNGQSELAAVIVGLARPSSGSIRMLGTDVTGASTRDRLRLGLGHIPQDRIEEGMIEEFTVEENFVLGRHFEEAFKRRGLLKHREIRAEATARIEEFDVQPPDPELRAGNLSGGNQQKLVASREMSRGARLLLAAHPTRGLDIAATNFIHTRLLSERDRGAGILLISSELGEVMALSDRICVMRSGTIVRDFKGILPSREEIGRHMVSSDRSG